MSLSGHNFNDAVRAEYVARYKDYPSDEKDSYEDPCEAIQQLFLEERTPLNAKEVVLKKLGHLVLGKHVGFEERVVRQAWLSTPIITSDVIYFHTDGRVKVVLDDPILSKLHSQSENVSIHVLKSEEYDPLGGTIFLGEGEESNQQYDTLNGEEISRRQVEEIREHFSKVRHDSQKNVLWQILLRHDKELIREYSCAMNALVEKKYDDMELWFETGIYIGYSSPQYPPVRACGAPVKLGLCGSVPGSILVCTTNLNACCRDDKIIGELRPWARHQKAISACR